MNIRQCQLINLANDLQGKIADKKQGNWIMQVLAWINYHQLARIDRELEKVIVEYNFYRPLHRAFVEGRVQLTDPRITVALTEVRAKEYLARTSDRCGADLDLSLGRIDLLLEFISRQTGEIQLVA
ncbi:MAG: hypothetical protein Q7S37_03800 [bacterium]|nr:hypothetical protein [bacterium]